MNKQGALIVISGFAGAGKGTIVKTLLEQYENYVLSVSATTRKPRIGEQEGVSYFFKTTEEFEQMIKEEQFIEYARYVDNYYGTPKAFVKEQRDMGKDVILEIEVQGALNIKKQYPDAILIFVTPPNAKELEERLRGRKTEDEATIKKRMARAYEESFLMENYDSIAINDEVESCAEQINKIIVSKHIQDGVGKRFIEEMQTQLKQYAKGAN